MGEATHSPGGRQHFTFAFSSSARILLVPLGVTPGTCSVEVGDDNVRIRFEVRLQLRELVTALDSSSGRSAGSDAAAPEPGK